MAAEERKAPRGLLKRAALQKTSGGTGGHQNL